MIRSEAVTVPIKHISAIAQRLSTLAPRSVARETGRRTARGGCGQSALPPMTSRQRKNEERDEHMQRTKRHLVASGPEKAKRLDTGFR